MLVRPLQDSVVGIYTSTQVREVSWHEGDVVRKLRISAGLKLEQLAELAGMSFTTIAALEIGKTRDPKRDTIDKLATAFGLTGKELRDMVPQQKVRLKQPQPSKRGHQQTEPVKRAISR